MQVEEVSSYFSSILSWLVSEACIRGVRRSERIERSSRS